MQCIKVSIEVEDIIKKSRFLAISIPCQTENESLQHLKKIQQQHPNASHIVFAHRIKTTTGIHYRLHDAGEPSGTAGKPVFQHLEGKNLINIMIVVIRYFGGIKLGAGGLTRAYSHAAKKVIEASIVTEYIEYKTIQLELNYKQMQNFEYQLKKLAGKIINQNFSDNINLMIEIPEKNVATLARLFSFKTSIENFPN